MGSASRASPAARAGTTQGASRLTARRCHEALWLPFDAAVREANAALEQAGEPGRISITRTIRERQYGAEGPDGSQRQIAVYLVLSVVEDRLTGGAYVSTNQSRLSMYLVPEKTAADVALDRRVVRPALQYRYGA